MWPSPGELPAGFDHGAVLHLLPLLQLLTLSGSPQFYISRLDTSDFIKEVHFPVASGSRLPPLHNCADEFRTWVKTALAQTTGMQRRAGAIPLHYLSPRPCLSRQPSPAHPRTPAFPCTLSSLCAGACHLCVITTHP